MNLLSPDWTPSPAALHRGGAALLWGGLGVSLLVLVHLLWNAPDLLPALLVATVAAPLFYALVRHPFAHLCVVLAASALILRHQPGIQIEEVLYGLYCMVYLACWFVAEIGLRRENPFDSPHARTLGAFLLLVVLLLPVSVMYGGTPRLILRELTALSLLGFVFPIKAACARRPSAVRTLVLVGLGLALFVSFRNLLTYQALLNNAERIADMLRGRVDSNVNILSVAALFCAVFLVYTRRLRHAVVFLGLFALFFGGVILSLTRGFWVAFASSLVFLFFVVERSRKVRLVWMGVGGGIALLTLGFLFFGDFVTLFLYGLLERLTTLQDAATKDISLLARIHESRGAIARIVQNPILGHGIGAPFSYADILSRSTVSQTFVHNGYLALWYKFGPLGTGLVFFWWFGSMRRGLRLSRRADLPSYYRLVALGAATALSVFVLSALTSNPFYHKDYLFTLAYLVGLILGVQARFGQPAATAPPALT